MLLVISLLAILLGLGTIVFTNFARKDQAEVTGAKIISSLSEARAKTLAGYSLGQVSGLNFGIHFETEYYSLFAGTSFNPNDSLNQKFLLPAGLRINEIFFPSGNVIFKKITGDVLNFDASHNCLILEDQQSDQQRKICLNKLGVATVE